jgi:fructosamine-3-kinase
LNFKIQIEALLNEPVSELTPLSGGDTAENFLCLLESGKSIFVKSDKDIALEIDGLQTLAKKAFPVPNIIASNKQLLVLDYIKSGNNCQANIGEQLANLHKNTTQYYGYSIDNKIGRSTQYNAINQKITHWFEFFWQYRITPQLEMANNSQLTDSLNQIKNKIKDLLSETNSQPTLLHGDLWSGNVMCDNQQNAIFIDPAVYYGDRESDFALADMFGGFSADFYQAYNNIYPLEQGFEKRLTIYKLYHYLNHYNIFGNSYLSSVNSCITKINNTY